MSIEMRPIAVEETPITKTTFKLQGWEKKTATENGEKYYYWILPLPKDNPDENAPALISSASDEYLELNLPKGRYVVELYDLAGLGYCESEEEIEILYRALTGYDIYEKLIDVGADEEEEKQNNKK